MEGKIPITKRATGSPLTIKQQRFAQAMVKNNGNATQSAVDAGYKIKNRKVATVTGSQLLSIPSVKQEVSALLEEAGLSKQEVLDKLRQAVDAGLKVDARNSDSLRGLNMILKLHDMFPATRKRIEKVDMTLKVNSMDNKELAEYFYKMFAGGNEVIEGEAVESVPNKDVV